MSAVPSTRELLATAIAAARHGGDYAAGNKARRDEIDRRTRYDVKLRLDVETQQEVEAHLRNAWPGHALFGEEAGTLDRDAEFCWIIDPIDGTMNFMRGLPHWCTSVAVMRRGTVVAGAVYAPETGECFSATQDGPAECNGEPIRVSDVDDLEQVMICTAGLSRAGASDGLWTGYRSLATETGKIRVLGAAALDLCYVACGRVDALYELGLHIWDVAAGGLIIERAGGTVETVGDGSDYFCTNGVVGSELRALLGI